MFTDRFKHLWGWLRFQSRRQGFYRWVCMDINCFLKYNHSSLVLVYVDHFPPAFSTYIYRCVGIHIRMRKMGDVTSASRQQQSMTTFRCQNSRLVCRTNIASVLYQPLGNYVFMNRRYQYRAISWFCSLDVQHSLISMHAPSCTFLQ